MESFEEVDLRNMDSSSRGKGAGEFAATMSTIEERVEERLSSDNREGSLHMDEPESYFLQRRKVSSRLTRGGPQRVRFFRWRT